MKARCSSNKTNVKQNSYFLQDKKILIETRYTHDKSIEKTYKSLSKRYGSGNKTRKRIIAFIYITFQSSMQETYSIDRGLSDNDNKIPRLVALILIFIILYNFFDLIYLSIVKLVED